MLELEKKGGSPPEFSPNQKNQKQLKNKGYLSVDLAALETIAM